MYNFVGVFSALVLNVYLVLELLGFLFQWMEAGLTGQSGRIVPRSVVMAQLVIVNVGQGHVIIQNLTMVASHVEEPV